MILSSSVVKCGLFFIGVSYSGIGVASNYMYNVRSLLTGMGGFPKKFYY